MDSFTDIIGKALDVYATREQAKIDSRLAASQAQAQAYEDAWRYQQAAPASSGVPSWVGPLVGFALLGALVYVVARK